MKETDRRKTAKKIITKCIGVIVIAFSIIRIVLLVLDVVSDADRRNAVLDSMTGYYAENLASHDGERWDASYDRYFYSEIPETLGENEHFKEVSAGDVETIAGYVETFEELVDRISASSELSQDYKFDIACVNEGDWFCVYEDGWEDFDLFIFDTEGKTLYYFRYDA